MEVGYEKKEVEGKTARAKTGDPSFGIRGRSRKVAVHKPQAV